jgi:AraC family transcriptional regulator
MVGRPSLSGWIGTRVWRARRAMLYYVAASLFEATTYLSPNFGVIATGRQMSVRPLEKADRRLDTVEVAGVRTGLLGRVVSSRGVQIMAAHGVLNDSFENRITADTMLLGYTPQRPTGSLVRLDGEPFRPVGTLSFIAPGVSVTMRGDGPFTWAACLFGSDFLAALTEAGGGLRLETIDFIRAIASERLTYLGAAMFREISAPGFAAPLFAESIGMQIALEIARYDGRRNGEEGAHSGGLAPWQMRRLESYVRDHLSEDLTLVTLARLLGISVRHLSHTMRRSKGMGVHRWIAECRLVEARRMLSATRLPTHEIARRSAFGSPNAFSTAFRATSGLAPAEYRRLTRE